MFWSDLWLFPLGLDNATLAAMTIDTFVVPPAHTNPPLLDPKETFNAGDHLRPWLLRTSLLPMVAKLAPRRPVSVLATRCCHRHHDIDALPAFFSPPQLCVLVPSDGQVPDIVVNLVTFVATFVVAFITLPKLAAVLLACESSRL